MRCDSLRNGAHDRRSSECGIVGVALNWTMPSHWNCCTLLLNAATQAGSNFETYDGSRRHWIDASDHSTAVHVSGCVPSVAVNVMPSPFALTATRSCNSRVLYSSPSM